ncbi:flavin monoamine oxidase family protein [Nocardia sp. NPDC020380]|uniref:flavin monoamine oxidase family protein n=1 Tax=Nocardia sp. NPDC020380 TaxID=3364309 RepID=UPI00378E3459
MPRTPMFRMAQRTTADYAGAARTRMPLADYRAARTDHFAQAADRTPILNRRSLFRAGAVLAGAALIARAGGPRPAAAAPGDVPRVVIVGAGIAGLNAALTLADKGIPATVYEASDRVGGRMYSESRYWEGGQVSEYGGEAIDSDHTAILDLCKRMGLPLVDAAAAAPPGSSDVLYFEGGYVSEEKYATDFRPVFAALQADLAAVPQSPTWNDSNPAGVALSNMTLTEWIATRVPGGYSNWIARFLDDAYVVEYGLPTEMQTALNIVELMGAQETPAQPSVWGASDERYQIEGGNQRLPQAIAAKLPPGALQHNYRLEAITRNSDGTQTLTFDESGTRRTLQADHTILTLPVGVLKRIDYSAAGFDDRMRGAIEALPMGSCTKLNMQFTARPWVGRGPWPGESTGMSFTDIGYQQIWDATAGQPGTQGIALQYGGGLGAWRFQPPAPFLTADDPSVRAYVDSVMPQFERVVPGVAPLWNGRATLSAWHLNPFVNGAYSAYPIGYCHRFAGYEGTRQGNIHLAGEHTSLDSAGYMNGGAESGARAATEILSDLGL